MDAFKRYGISTARFTTIEHPSHCVYRFQDTCLTRDYPTNSYQDLIYTWRILYENAKRVYSNLTPWHELFELDNAEARKVPEDPANFHLSQINN